MTTPKISLIASAARPENWMGLYESIGENDVEFEIVFVGPNAPKEILPDNFIYIKSNVKPAQCWEIAARHARGELIMYICDDMLFTSERPLDEVCRVYDVADDENAIVSLNFDLPDGWNRFISRDYDSPMVPSCGTISARLWNEIGGLDKNFIALGWDHDLIFRVLNRGGKVHLSDAYIGEEIELPGKPRSRGSTLLRDSKSTDIARVYDLWVTDGKVHFNRTQPFEPFSDTDILTNSQHPQGRWKHQSDLYNKIITGRTFYALKSLRFGISGRMRRFKFRYIPFYLRRIFNKNTARPSR
jgi:hypothetical protein